jgi:hypothetical protein
MEDTWLEAAGTRSPDAAVARARDDLRALERRSWRMIRSEVRLLRRPWVSRLLPPGSLLRRLASAARSAGRSAARRRRS